MTDTDINKKVCGACILYIGSSSHLKWSTYLKTHLICACFKFPYLYLFELIQYNPEYPNIEYTGGKQEFFVESDIEHKECKIKMGENIFRLYKGILIDRGEAIFKDGHFCNSNKYRLTEIT